MRRLPLLLLACIWLAGCRDPAPPPAAIERTAASADEGGAISSPSVATEPLDEDVLAGSRWPPATLTSGDAWISCSTDYAEDGIRAGDVIADSHWTIWVREGDMCHSACVFVLAAGDNRLVSGPVGIHRIIRLHSDATTRAELDAELRGVHDNIKAYLSRNGVDVAVADMMMTVPSRALRLLTPEELRRYGISGRNPAQEDLERIQLVRLCGVDFVHRKEAFVRAFEKQCAGEGDDVGVMGECGLALREEYGFPDSKCPAESPLSEYDAL